MTGKITYSIRAGANKAGANKAGEWDDDQDPRNPDTGALTKTRTRTKRPALYKVLLLNDDFTPMDFVIHVLQRTFHMTLEQATGVMLAVHQKGVGVAGIFTYEIAETKVKHVMAYAKKHEHPLQCSLEKE